MYCNPVDFADNFSEFYHAYFWVQVISLAQEPLTAN